MANPELDNYVKSPEQLELAAYKQAVNEYTKSPYEFQGNELAEAWITKRVKKILKENAK